MDIYAKAKYNKPEQLSSVVNGALKLPSKHLNEASENVAADSNVWKDLNYGNQNHNKKL